MSGPYFLFFFLYNLCELRAEFGIVLTVFELMLIPREFGVQKGLSYMSLSEFGAQKNLSEQSYGEFGMQNDFPELFLREFLAANAKS